jgi:hypothetical protein
MQRNKSKQAALQSGQADLRSREHYPAVPLPPWLTPHHAVTSQSAGPTRGSWAVTQFDGRSVESLEYQLIKRFGLNPRYQLLHGWKILAFKLMQRRTLLLRREYERERENLNKTENGGERTSQRLLPAYWLRWLIADAGGAASFGHDFP